MPPASRSGVRSPARVIVEQFDTHINTLRAAVASAPAQAKDELNRKLSEMEEERAKALNAIDTQIKSES
jgi:hypothetical protein